MYSEDLSETNFYQVALIKDPVFFHLQQVYVKCQAAIDNLRLVEREIECFVPRSINEIKMKEELELKCCDANFNISVVQDLVTEHEPAVRPSTDDLDNYYLI